MSSARSPKSCANAIGHPLDAEVALLLVALVLADLRRRVAQGVERRVERIDALELELAPVAEPHGLIHLSALEELREDAERRRPAPDAHAGAGLGQRLGDGEAEASVVGHAGDERALPGEVDGEHGKVSGSS